MFLRKQTHPWVGTTELERHLKPSYGLAPKSSINITAEICIWCLTALASKSWLCYFLGVWLWTGTESVHASVSLSVKWDPLEDRMAEDLYMGAEVLTVVFRGL